MRVLLLGNAGAGKSFMAHTLAAGRNIPILSLDDITWNPGVQRRPYEDSLSELLRFVHSNEHWIIEGCYGDLIEAVLPYCSELRFLNPGIECCIEHCYSRLWEPKKFASAGEQEAMLLALIDWVRQYETRDDEYGLLRHRKLFDAFSGPKQEYLTSGHAANANGPD